MLGSVRPMSQSTPLACPHSIRAFPGGRPGSGLRGRREVEVRLSTNSHPPGLTAAAIRASTAGPYPAIWCSKARQVTRSYALSGSSVVEPVGLVWLGWRSSGTSPSAADKRKPHGDDVPPGRAPGTASEGGGRRPSAWRVSEGRGGGFLTCARPSSLDRVPGSRPQPARRRALRHCWLPVSRSSHRGSVQHPPVR